MKSAWVRELAICLSAIYYKWVQNLLYRWGCSRLFMCQHRSTYVPCHR